MHDCQQSEEYNPSCVQMMISTQAPLLTVNHIPAGKQVTVLLCATGAKSPTLLCSQTAPDLLQFEKNDDGAPREEAKRTFLDDLESPCPELRDKIIITFHESTSQANEDRPTLGAEKGTSAVRPKLKGSGIMVSDFIDEKNGLSEEQYE